MEKKDVVALFARLKNDNQVKFELSSNEVLKSFLDSIELYLDQEEFDYRTFKGLVSWSPSPKTTPDVLKTNKIMEKFVRSIQERERIIDDQDKKYLTRKIKRYETKYGG